MDEQMHVLHERLTMEEEGDFVALINDAVADGLISDEDAIEMVDREFELQAQSK